MSSPSVTTALLWRLLSAWSSFAAAFVVVVRNESDSPVIPCIQRKQDDLEVLDPAGAVPSKGERVYDNARPWLRSDLMKIKEKDNRTLSLVFTNQHKVVDCGKISLENGTVLTATASLDCTAKPVEKVTKTDLYTHTAIADPKNKELSGWVIASIDDSGECRECDGASAIKRYYADGPRNLFSQNVYGEKSTITVQACNTHSGQIEDLPLCSWRENACGTHAMNNCVDCQDINHKHILRIEYTAPTIDRAGRSLPTGQYSGIVKIRELKGNTNDILDEFYVNVEIEEK